MSVCESGVTVQDTTPPELTCPPDVDDVQAASELGASVDNVQLDVAVDGLCDEAVVVTDDRPSDFYSLQQDTLVTFTAVDASGNQSVCRVTVRVVPTDPLPGQQPPGQEERIVRTTRTSGICGVLQPAIVAVLLATLMTMRVADCPTRPYARF